MKAVKDDFNEMDEGRQTLELAEARSADSKAYTMKRASELNQRDYNKSVENEDAEYKLISFDGIRAAKGLGLGDTKADLEVKFNENSFEAFYRNDLAADVLKKLGR